MRQLLYSMLVTQGDQEAQKVCTHTIYIHTYVHAYILTYVRICTYTVQFLCTWYTLELEQLKCTLCIWGTSTSCAVSMLAVCCGASPHSCGPPPLQTLVDIFSHMRRAGGESPELTSLITYLAFLKNANRDTADRLHSLVKDNNDPLLLTLGSLAEYAPKDVSASSATP